MLHVSVMNDWLTHRKKRRPPRKLPSGLLTHLTLHGVQYFSDNQEIPRLLWYLKVHYCARWIKVLHVHYKCSSMHTTSNCRYSLICNMTQGDKFHERYSVVGSNFSLVFSKEGLYKIGHSFTLLCSFQFGNHQVVIKCILPFNRRNMQY